jgi:hypothetical protein
VLAFERIPRPETGHPVRVEAEDRKATPNISVIFTSAAPTLNALKRAGALATRYGARITLLVPQVVPFPLPLENPPVLIDWDEQRFQAIAGESPVGTTVQIFLCRDRLETLTAVLRPGSIVVLGAPKRWWPTAEARVARKLRKAGHEVILAEME